MTLAEKNFLIIANLSPQKIPKKLSLIFKLATATKASYCHNNQ